MEMTSKRDNTLDCACGILIIHMILGHIFQWSATYYHPFLPMDEYTLFFYALVLFQGRDIL